MTVRPMYQGEWHDEQDVFLAFHLTVKEQRGVHILYAEYDCPSYEGSAFVLFTTQDGKLFEVNGSHCSCDDFWGQWEPEETTAEAVLARPRVPSRAKDQVKLYLQSALARRNMTTW